MSKRRILARLLYALPIMTAGTIGAKTNLLSAWSLLGVALLILGFALADYSYGRLDD